MSSSKTIVKILWRYQQREDLSEEELAELRLWLMESPKNEELFSELSDSARWEKEVAKWKNKDPTATWEKISKRIEEISPEAFKKKRDFGWLLAAASVLLLTASAAVYILLFKHPVVTAPDVSQSEVSIVKSPLGTATLTLSDGNVVSLDSLPAGRQTKQGETVVTKTDSTALAYSTIAGGGGEHYNTLTTAKGNQYQVVLSDGTKVWLNAASSLRFPVSFNGFARRVELTGEAYFEVAKDKTKPFVVETSQSIHVKVFGTHFNIKAYNEEPTVNVALLEGSVSAGNQKDSVFIKPGDEARIKDGSFSIHPINTDQVTAWKNKLFWFKNDLFETIMRDLSRWYDIEVTYDGDIKDTYTGILPLNLPLSNVLAILEKGGNVHFTIKDGNKVTVRP